jgi:type II secretory pathway pseudopilin PulG
LIELIIVVGIVAVLLSLIIAAVQQVRTSSIRAEAKNNVRQILLATHSFASDHRGQLPNINGGNNTPNPRQSLFFSLLPYIGENNLYQKYFDRPLSARETVRVLLNPGDPTSIQQAGVTSFAANAQVFTANLSFPTKFRDGTSNTIAFAEHLSICNNLAFMYCYYEPAFSLHRATFADGGPDVDHHANDGDNYPVTTDFVSRPAWGKDITFQTAPLDEQCDERLASTADPEGMLAGVADGSVRLLSPAISPFTYWGAITPAKGEILSDW